MDTFEEQKKGKTYFCKNCDFTCGKKYNYRRHILTHKHKRIHFGHILDTQNEQKEQEINISNKNFVCNCGKHYKYSQGLSKHKKSCKIMEKEDNEEEPTDKSLIMLLLKENSQLKNMVLDVCQKIQPLNNTVNSHNVNSHNKTFNLNVFLNEHCKDAMNLMDFVDSLKLQLSDLESVGKLGFVNGISNIIVKSLNSLDETKRPIHCTDAKREILYVKDEDKWEKEQENKKIRKAIKQIAHKNSKLIPEFKAKHPDCIKSNSIYSDQLNKLIIEAMGGHGDNDLEKEDKIIKNIAKEVLIDKANY
jgi:hypothetical protein